MKKITVFISFSVILLMVLAAKPGRSSSGAPASHTGAPDEQTCAASGCHDDNPINKGTASLSLELGEGITNYVAGETYKVKIKITDAHKQRFGFQILALNPKTKQNAGKFLITDSVRTQIVNNIRQLKEREYVTYTFNGTDAISEGIGEWYVNWTAPKDPNEKVTFYVAAVSANDDMHDKGDKVYTKSLTLK